MTKNSLSEIRKEFLDFFSNHDHDVIASSSLVPHNDESLLFTNAGMVQFKNYFTGLANPKKSKRAVTSQKCVRAGGKHNDLENVGLTKRHHTFFEMLGNFSFGDYFKADAIELAWKLITKNYSIDPNKLIITVYHTDEEAFNIWKKVSGFDEKKILRISSNDNFWEMGDTGPCGPCSEIFYDHGPEFQGGLPGSPNEGDRYVEIWNLVFMQFNKLGDGKKELLPRPSIDTGMGIERVTAVLQGTSDNYDIDLFRNIINKTQDILKLSENDKTRIPLRIISDHLRSVSFLISDGVLPANEGRGYVLRRILRRAIRHLYNLKIKKASFYKLVPILLEEMGDHFNELFVYKELISQTIKIEEEKFLETIEKGLKILEEEDLKNNSKKVFSGRVAFKLYDTYGFPLDLTNDVLKASNKKINMDEFNQEMNKQKEMSKKSWKGGADNNDEYFWNKISDNLQATEFLGYEFLQVKDNIQKIVHNNEELKFFNKADENLSLFFNKTPFYAESGGQIGDSGIIENDNFTFEVVDTQKRADKVYEHYGRLLSGNIEVNKVATLKVDVYKRKKITAHHSATHLLHSALRKKLGNHVTQKGSLVSESKLRFDISHNKSIFKEIIYEIEEDINSQIFRNSKTKYSILNKEEAIKKGAMAIFGEKYGEKVRVVEIGLDNENKEKPYSVELCGGTHVNRTGDIGLIKIISEGSLASGVRRIEAVVGSLALDQYKQMENIINNISEKLKINHKLLPDRVTKLLDEKRQLEKRKKNDNLSSNNKIDIKKIELKGYELNYAVFENKGAKELKDLSDKLVKKAENIISVLFSNLEGKITVVIAISNDLEKKLNAIELIREITPILGGRGGGGKPTLAQGGGSKSDNVEEVLRFVKEKLNN